MFMTNLELVYGKNKTNAGTFKLSAPTEHDIVSSSYYESGSISGNSETSFVQSDTDILKSDDTKQKIGVLSNKDDYAVKLLCDKYYHGLIDSAHGRKEDGIIKPDPILVKNILEECLTNSG